MPFITAREDAGLSRTPSSQDIDAIVFSGQKLAVDWLKQEDTTLSQIRLAGNYTCPETGNVLRVGDLRFVNSTRFEIPSNAWLQDPDPITPPQQRTSLNNQAVAPTPAEANKMLRSLATELIKRYEGFREDAYPDPGTGGAPWTIGYGFTRINNQPVQRGQTISRSEADNLFDAELNAYIEELSAKIPFWSEMTAQQQCALTSFSFNNGVDFYGGPHHETITKYLREKNWQQIPTSLLLYVNPGTPAEEGLRRRRQEEGRLWAQGLATATGSSIQRQPSTQQGQQGQPPANGLDPRGSEEEGLVGPRMRAPVKPGDSYLLVNDRDKDMEAYDHAGNFLWKIPCLARGQYGENDWRTKNSDTPPGLYKIGTIYKDYEKDATPPCTDSTIAYGWYSFDLEELEGQERTNGRAGIMIHGGGSNCGWPGAWEPRQQLFPTHGCVRAHNIDLKEKILPLTKHGTVYVGVFQEV